MEHFTSHLKLAPEVIAPMDHQALCAALTHTKESIHTLLDIDMIARQEKAHALWRTIQAQLKTLTLIHKTEVRSRIMVSHPHNINALELIKISNVMAQDFFETMRTHPDLQPLLDMATSLDPNTKTLLTHCCAPLTPHTYLATLIEDFARNQKQSTSFDDAFHYIFSNLTITYAAQYLHSA